MNGHAVYGLDNARWLFASGPRRRQTARVSELATSALTRLEDEIRAAITEHEDEIVTAVARVLVGTAIEARNGGKSRNGRRPGPRLCACGRLAAPARTVCNSCRGRMRRDRERLRRQALDEHAAAAAGQRGERARELVAGERRDPAQPVALD
jgi:hypothetical protein